MPPAINLADAETDEQRKRRLGATMPPVGSRGFYGAAMDAANRDSAGPPRGVDKSDSQEFLQRAMSTLKPAFSTAAKAGSALPGNASGAGNSSGDPSRSTMPPVLSRSASGTSEGHKGDGSAEDQERFGHLDEMVRQSFLRRAATVAQKAMRSVPANASPATPPTPTMPPAGTPPIVRSPNQDQATMPPVQIKPLAQQTGNIDEHAQTMPPATFDTVGLKPHDIPSQQTMPPANYAQRYEELAAKEPTREQFPADKLPWWKKVLGGLAAGAGGFGKKDNTSFNLAHEVFGSPEAKAEKEFGQQHDIWQRGLDAIQKESGLSNTASEMRLRGAEARKQEAEAKNLENPEDSTDKKIDEYTNDRGQRVLTFQRADNSTYDKVGGKVQEKQTGHTSPFEAFAYGTPDEKKSAQDFLDLEHRLGGKYRTPSEFEEKYRLFKQDPETYRAMFGDKTASGPDRATATKMLNYFDRRRREINQDFTLEDAQKQEQLKDVENLEQPFLDAVQPGANRGGGAGGAGDRVEVIHPNGQRGTIPRSQLGAAKKKGYRVVE